MESLTLATRVFKSFPAEKRKSIIDLIVNTQSTKSPRTKAMKDYDKVRYPEPLKGAMNFQPALFDHCVKIHLS